MNRFLHSLLLLLVVLFCLVPIAVVAQGDALPLATNTLAADPPLPPAMPDPAPDAGVDPFPGIDNATFTTVVLSLGTIVLGLLGAFAYTQSKTIQALYHSLPPEATTFLRAVLEIVADKADATPSPLDDAALANLARALGYDLQRTTDGRIILVPQLPTS